MYQYDEDSMRVARMNQTQYNELIQQKLIPSLENSNVPIPEVLRVLSDPWSRAVLRNYDALSSFPSKNRDEDPSSSTTVMQQQQLDRVQAVRNNYLNSHKMRSLILSSEIPTNAEREELKSIHEGLLLMYLSENANNVDEVVDASYLRLVEDCILLGYERALQITSDFVIQRFLSENVKKQSKTDSKRNKGGVTPAAIDLERIVQALCDTIESWSQVLSEDALFVLGGVMLEESLRLFQSQMCLSKVSQCEEGAAVLRVLSGLESQLPAGVYLSGLCAVKELESVCM